MFEFYDQTVHTVVDYSVKPESLVERRLWASACITIVRIVKGRCNFERKTNEGFPFVHRKSDETGETSDSSAIFERSVSLLDPFDGLGERYSNYVTVHGN